jgi:hypothetical protein
MRSTTLAAGLAAAAAGCGHKDSDGGGGGASAAQGCLQGVVMDGLTGQRVAVNTATAGNGIFVLFQGSLIPASFASATVGAPGSNPNLDGEYSLCGIPLDEQFPILAWVDGYAPFEGVIEVPSTAASRSPNARADLLRPYPSELANIRLYPKATAVKDLDVLVLHNGAPLANATVVLRATGDNFLSDDGMPFLPPRNTRTPTLTGTSDAGGHTAFPAAELVLGGHYTYTVIPPDGGATVGAKAAADAFVLGLRDAGDATEPYRITVKLGESIGQLTAISRSTDSEDPDAKGMLVVYFNREIELVPGTADQVTASLSGAVKAELKVDEPGDDEPDQVLLTIEGNKLTLQPLFKTNPDTDINKEIDLAITYAGIKVRPKATPYTLDPFTVTGTVRFYR